MLGRCNQCSVQYPGDKKEKEVRTRGDERFGDLTGGKSSQNSALYRKVNSSKARDG